jgi:hypothetical protein
VVADLSTVWFTSFGGRVCGVGMAVLCHFADNTASARLFQLFTEVNERGVPVPRCPSPPGLPSWAEVPVGPRRT